MIPLRILTVDDELLALRRLKLLLQTIPLAEQVGEASGCADARRLVNELHPDALLLDIKMRDGSGFEIVEWLAGRPNPPLIVFVTAFDEFAAQAFENDVSDYLLKPVERDRLVRALERVRHQLKSLDAEQRVEELQRTLSGLRAALGSGREPSFETEFWLRGPTGLVRVPVDGIDCVSSEDEYVAIHTSSASYLMRGSLRQFAARVSPDLFVQVHRRWMARRDAIAQLATRQLGGSEVVLRNGKRLPAGRVHLKLLRKKLAASSQEPMAL